MSPFRKSQIDHKVKHATQFILAIEKKAGRAMADKVLKALIAGRGY